MRTEALVFGLLAVAGLAGCNGSATPRDESPSTPSVTTTVRPNVTWPAATSVDDRALGALIEASYAKGTDAREIRALVARSPVPVLAPQAVRLASPTLVVEGEYYALTGRLDGATINMQGTRAAHRYESVDPTPGNRDLRGTRGFVTVNEGIRTASWIENGAAYTVDVECSDLKDDRCANDAFLLSIIGQLAFIGGSGR